MSSGQSIGENQIRDQVSRILKSADFRRSRILSDFLRYIVSETLEGNENGLKEYVIATEVLHKSPDFNPQLDAVVRIHAGRLRNLLDNYYQAAGKNDPLKISIPKGRYIPLFEFGEAEPSVQGNATGDPVDLHIEALPTIAVLPFECLKDNNREEVICSVLSRDLTIGLSYFKELKVISNHASAYARDHLENWKDIKSYLGASYIITGGCMSEQGILKVDVELHRLEDNQMIWAEALIIEDFNSSELKEYSTLVKKILAKICGYLGLIYRSTFNAHVPQDYDTLYAIYWHNKYHQKFSYEAFQEVSGAIDRALSVNPDNSMLNAFKAEMYLNMLAMDIVGDIDYKEEGTKLVSRAISLDQNDQHAWQIMAWSSIMGKKKMEYDHAVEKCLSINPFNAHFIGSIGFGHQCVGEYEKGLGFMLEAIDLSPYYPWQINFGMCLYYFHKRDFEQAHYWSKMMKRPGLIWDPMLQISALGWMNKAKKASHLVDDLVKLSPSFAERAEIIVDRFLFDKDLQHTILRGLALAGIRLRHLSFTV